MKFFRLDHDYTYQAIEKAVEQLKKEYQHDFDMIDYEELGNDRIGESFIVVKDQKLDNVCSFVLTGATFNGYIYTCIYNDWRKDETN